MRDEQSLVNIGDWCLVLEEVANSLKKETVQNLNENLAPESLRSCTQLKPGC